MCIRLSLNVGKITLIRKGQWAPLYCSECGLSRKASKWLCPCNQPWHTCSQHRPEGFLCRKPNKVARGPLLERNIKHTWPLGSYFPSEAKNRAYGKRSAQAAPFSDKPIANKNMHSQKGNSGCSGGTEIGYTQMLSSSACSQPMRELARKRSPKWGEAMPRKRKQARPSRVQKVKSKKLLPLKRSLPVAWGRDIFYKVPRLADQFSKITKPLEAGRKRLYGKQPDPLRNTRFQLPRPPE